MTSSQPSPTNLSDELDKILRRYFVYAHSGRGDLDTAGNPIDDRISNTVATITAAYAEAIDTIIGEDESEYRVVDTEYADPKRHRQINGNAVVRNRLRSEQRQRLQRLLPTNGSDEGSADT